MDKKRPSLEGALLQKIKDGKGTVNEILNLTKEYNVSISKVSETLKKLMDRNQVTKSEDKYIIKSKVKKGFVNQKKVGGDEEKSKGWGLSPP